MKDIIICEDNVIVENLSDWSETRDIACDNISVRVEIDDEVNDVEFVSIKTLCDLYRKHVLNV